MDVGVGVPGVPTFMVGRICVGRLSVGEGVEIAGALFRVGVQAITGDGAMVAVGVIVA